MAFPGGAGLLFLFGYASGAEATTRYDSTGTNLLTIEGRMMGGAWWEGRWKLQATNLSVWMRLPPRVNGSVAAGKVQGGATILTRDLKAQPMPSGIPPAGMDPLAQRILGANEHPQISFGLRELTVPTEKSATNVQGAFQASGMLLFQGKSREFTFPVAFEPVGRSAFKVRGGRSLRHWDLGVEPYQHGLSSLKVEDDLRFSFECVLMRH